MQFFDHESNRFGEHRLWCKGLADGYFLFSPYTIGVFLSQEIKTPHIDTNRLSLLFKKSSVRQSLQKLLDIKGNQSVESLHKKLGRSCGITAEMARNKEGLGKAREMIRELEKEFWNDVFVLEVWRVQPELEKKPWEFYGARWTW